MRLGFIGTGSITTALVTGYHFEGFDPMEVFDDEFVPPEPRPSIIVSPRNPERAAALARKFSGVEVASDNQDVVDASDVVFLAVRPQDAEGIVKELSFRADQRIVSLLPTFRIETVQSWVAPATKICRACPLPSVAQRKGPVLVHGDEETLELVRLPGGGQFKAHDEGTFQRIWTVTGMISPLYDILSTMSSWVAGRDSDPLVEKYLAELTIALCSNRTRPGSDSFLELAAEAQTPGGLNEQAARMNREAGVPDAFREALEAIWARFEGPSS
ncbi:MAG: NAD(P)-binding domain-containing protein [Planctomycetota bacterium]